MVSHIRGNKIAQGRDAAKTYLLEHPDVMSEIETLVRESYMPDDDTDTDTEVKHASPDKSGSDGDDNDTDTDDDILGIDV